MATVRTLVSRAHSNQSHALSLAAAHSKTAPPSGEYVERGYEGERHEFIFAKVKFQDLKSLLGSKSVSIMYRPSVRYRNYCPDLIARDKKEEEKRRRDKMHRKKIDKKTAQRTKCSEIQNKQERQECREKKIAR